MPTDHDKSVIRPLAEKVAEIAQDPHQQERARMWQRLNDLDPERPMVRIYQIPWREMDVEGELTLECEEDAARAVEWNLRQTIYRWKHFPADMVVEPVYPVSYAINSTGYGMHADVEAIPHDSRGGVSAKHYRCQIADEKDVEKIQMPELSHDREATRARREWMEDLLGGVLSVEVRGKVAHNYAPWDRLAEWMSPNQILIDLISRPEFLHAAMERLTGAYEHEMDQLEEMNLLSIADGNYGVGQGGLGYTDELPQDDCDLQHPRLRDQWGGAMAQIFSEVSPVMHEEFALKYEKRLLDRFGLSYYGCCEPLHKKVDVIARNLPNLRKISMSPWVDAEEGAEAIDGRFVFSFKPNPAFLAPDGTWDKKDARRELERTLDAAAGCPVELILKDISTVRFEPRRLWEWAEMAMEVVEGR